MTDWALDKPPGFYLSSFRCVSAFVAEQVVSYAGPYPYIDGLILPVTQRIGSIDVRHEPRRAGQSTYTLRRLIRLWLAAWVNFSVLPLRVATVLGLVMAFAGMIALAVVAGLWLGNAGPSHGFRVADGRLPDVFGHAACLARAHRRVHRAHVPHGEPVSTGRGARSAQERSGRLIAVEGRSTARGSCRASRMADARRTAPKPAAGNNNGMRGSSTRNSSKKVHRNNKAARTSTIRRIPRTGLPSGIPSPPEPLAGLVR